MRNQNQIFFNQYLERKRQNNGDTALACEPNDIDLD